MKPSLASANSCHMQKKKTKRNEMNILFADQLNSMAQSITTVPLGFRSFGDDFRRDRSSTEVTVLSLSTK